MTEQRGQVLYMGDPVALGTAGSAILAIIPAVLSREGLFAELEGQLRFPVWGRNWDALYDWLSRLHWLTETSVVIIHEALPRLSPKDLRTYVSILSQANANWIERSEHKLIAVFPEAAADKIRNLEAPSNSHD